MHSLAPWLGLLLSSAIAAMATDPDATMAAGLAVLDELARSKLANKDDRPSCRR